MHIVSLGTNLVQKDINPPKRSKCGVDGIFRCFYSAKVESQAKRFGSSFSHGGGNLSVPLHFGKPLPQLKKSRANRIAFVRPMHGWFQSHGDRIFMVFLLIM
jgi:hypothetical protein